MKAENGLRKTAAAMAVLSAVLHLLMMGHGHLGWGLLMAAMALICFPCAGHLWRTGSFKAWMIIGVMNAAMVLVHLGLMAGLNHEHASAGRGHLAHDSSHAAHSVSGLQLGLAPETLFYSATVLALFEVVIAGAVLTWRTRNRQTQLHPVV